MTYPASNDDASPSAFEGVGESAGGVAAAVGVGAPESSPSGRVHKHTASFARRVVRTMTSEKTPVAARGKLREALVSLFACTDIDKRRSLNRVENVAAVLGCTGLYYMDKKYVEAREARLRLCGLMEDYDRQARPWLYPWLKKEKRPAARRVRKSPKMLPPAVSLIVRAMA